MTDASCNIGTLYFDPETQSSTPLRVEVLGMSILGERHGLKCSCSYCREFRGRAGIALPECKAGNSWQLVASRLGALGWSAVQRALDVAAFLQS